MLNVSESGTLVYPNFGPGDALSRVQVERELPESISDWSVNHHDFEFNGTITFSVESREDMAGDYIGVFVGEELRGLGERMYFPFGDSHMYIAMVYSNEFEGEELSFKYYDSKLDEVVAYHETLTFTSLTPSILRRLS